MAWGCLWQGFFFRCWRPCSGLCSLTTSLLMASPAFSTSTKTPLSNEELTEVACAMLCRPSSACSTRIGENLGRGKVICQWGDEVVNRIMSGDGWRRRHNGMKLLLRRLLIWAGIPVVCEVFNLFARSVPQEGLNRIEQGRRRQGLVPDLKIPAEEGGGSGVLCEVKCQSASNTRYPPLISYTAKR